MTIRARWLARYNVARLWAAVARRRYMWHPTARNRAELERRRRQVEQARRVLKRHPPGSEKPEPANGIDVSNLQGSIDFEAVRKAGYRFVYVKAGEGDWLDPTFLRNVIEARKAGLKVGAYQFLRPRPGRTGAEEARHFIDALSTAGLGKGDLRPVLDCEHTDPKTKRPLLEGAALRNYIGSFVNALHAHGFKPMIYTGTWWWGPFIGAHDYDLPLWIAAYQNTEPKLPKPWTSYAIWQFTSSGRVSGIHGDVDLNKCPDLRKVIA